MRNYFKAVTGHMSERSCLQAFFFFDDQDPEDMRRALGLARACGGVVSVWQSAPTVPSHVREVGEEPSAVLQPGQRRASEVAVAHG